MPLAMKRGTRRWVLARRASLSTGSTAASLTSGRYSALASMACQWHTDGLRCHVSGGLD
jgi:hypothetical protein